MQREARIANGIAHVCNLSRTILKGSANGVVNAIVPGAIDTPLLARSMGRRADPEAARAASRARHAMGRFGRPEEVADGVLYLASDSASFTTGIALPVDGGWLAK